MSALEKNTASAQPSWSPSPEHVQNANMTRFMAFVNKQWGQSLSNYQELYDWSVQSSQDFWVSIWDFCDVKAETRGERVLADADNIEKAKFFPDAKLNYAENLLRRRDDAVALYFYGEDSVKRTLTYKELYNQTSRLIQVLKEWGIQPGDRVASFLPNMPETIIAMLATSAIGAVFSTCSPDFGVGGVTDRFGQIDPKVFLTAEGYFYKGKPFDCMDKLSDILGKLPSVEKTIVVPYSRSVEETRDLCSGDTFVWNDLLSARTPKEIQFEAFPFNHPLYVMYSSGTTGVPKCIVHGAGGTLLQHLKEHQLHTDVKRDDKMFYFTTCSWMMWHWLVSGLASEASLVLYDGMPTYPKPDRLFDIADEVGMTLFGTSAKYIDALAHLGVKPIETHKLDTVRAMASTGSPLVAESYDYVYSSIKKDMNLASISGGTDIVSCFILGNPIAPVYRGELQTRGLGMNVEVFDDDAKHTDDKGELVCTAPFPCQPLGFWGDDDGSKYHEAYFAEYENVWHHGDFVGFTEHGGMIIYGRSDAVLNPGGVRIGTAEIYRQVEQVEEVAESIVVGQEWDNDVRVVLFVKLDPGHTLDEELTARIKQQIRSRTTPRHVPAKVLQVEDIPRTRNGKIAELAVKNVIHGKKIKNVEALANPDCLEEYKDRPELTE